MLCSEELPGLYVMTRGTSCGWLIVGVSLGVSAWVRVMLCTRATSWLRKDKLYPRLLTVRFEFVRTSLVRGCSFGFQRGRTEHFKNGAFQLASRQFPQTQIQNDLWSLLLRVKIPPTKCRHFVCFVRRGRGRGWVVISNRCTKYSRHHPCLVPKTALTFGSKTNDVFSMKEALASFFRENRHFL